MNGKYKKLTLSEARQMAMNVYNDTEKSLREDYENSDGETMSNFPTEYRRADLPPTLTVEQRDAIVAGMVAIIREISEEYWAASWYSGIEYTIYKDASDTTQNHRLKVLSRLINGWIHVPVGEDDPQFIPMDEWLRLFEKWKGKRS